MEVDIILDAGHGGFDNGASYMGRAEKDDVLRLTGSRCQIKRSRVQCLLYPHNRCIQFTKRKSTACKSVRWKLFYLISPKLRHGG